MNLVKLFNDLSFMFAMLQEYMNYIPGDFGHIHYKNKICFTSLNQCSLNQGSLNVIITMNVKSSEKVENIISVKLAYNSDLKKNYSQISKSL